ncbi:hypothetical protein, partial [Staphylococcus aureus]|uniref:hypothetical protein n=1 Tax=Staphylococcus aureus TaxID=1280 RepID=UPI0039BEBFC5
MADGRTNPVKNSNNRRSSGSRSNRGFLAQIPTKDIIKTPAQRLAEAQAFAEQQRQQEMKDNRMNEFNPYGSATYETDASGNTARRINLSPEQQALYDQ